MCDTSDEDDELVDRIESTEHQVGSALVATQTPTGETAPQKRARYRRCGSQRRSLFVPTKGQPVLQRML